MDLSLGWPYLWDGLISEMDLFLGWTYLWDGLISGMDLSLGWAYMGSRTIPLGSMETFSVSDGLYVQVVCRVGNYL